MKNAQDEQFVRIVLFRADMEESVEYFERAKVIDDKFVRDALIKMGIITYAKSFMDNTGIHKEVRKYRIPKSVVPDEYTWLHEMFMDYRGNFIGHSNFKVIKPTVGPLTDTPLGQMIPIQYTGISFNHWFTVDSEEPDDPLIIDHAIRLVQEIIKDIPRTKDNKEVFAI